MERAKIGDIIRVKDGGGFYADELNGREFSVIDINEFKSGRPDEETLIEGPYGPHYIRHGYYDIVRRADQRQSAVANELTPAEEEARLRAKTHAALAKVFG